MSERLLYKGKRACELTREEAIEAAVHFHTAHLESYAIACAAERRMHWMSEALTKEQIRLLDRWIADHGINQQDAVKGDGTPKYVRWQDYR